MFSAMVARRKVLAINAGDFVFVMVNRVMDDPVDTRVWNFLPRLKNIANIRHICPLKVDPIVLLRITSV